MALVRPFLFAVAAIDQTQMVLTSAEMAFLFLHLDSTLPRCSDEKVLKEEYGASNLRLYSFNAQNCVTRVTVTHLFRPNLRALI